MPQILILKVSSVIAVLRPRIYDTEFIKDLQWWQNKSFNYE